MALGSIQKLVLAYAKNALRAKLTLSPWFDPMVATLYVTPLCNLRCTYCEDFGAHRNDGYRRQVLATGDMVRLIDLLAAVTSVLYLTGGEPTLRSDLVELLRHARPRFGYLAMNTNALLLHDHEPVLDLVDALVISVDSIEAGRFDSTLSADPTQVRRLLANVRWAAGEQRRRRFTLVVTAVVTPGRVEHARAVRDLCFEIGAQFSLQHLSEARRPSEELDRDPAFHAFVAEVIDAKRRGMPVSGSELYLRRNLKMEAYACTPTVAPHVDWLGRLAYPCRELPDHVLVDLLAAGSYRDALAEGARRWGAPPAACSRCGERCYVELSTLVRRPVEMAREVISHLGARRGHGG